MEQVPAMSRAPDLGPSARLPDPELWAIPSLDPRMQADRLIAPVAIWGAQARSSEFHGTYAFYTDDWRFAGLWRKPDALRDTGCVAAVEPNFTTLETSSDEEIWRATYKKRVLASYWQSQGIRVLVDLNVAERAIACNLVGVPVGWRAFATRSHRAGGSAALEREYQVACNVAETSDILFAVFGGSRRTADYIAGRAARGMPGSWVHVPEHIEVKRGRARPFVG